MQQRITFKMAHPFCGPLVFASSGKAHLRRAIVYHEEALRVCDLCTKLRNIEILQEILSVAHKRSLLKFSQQEQEDDFVSLMEAPDILCKYFTGWNTLHKRCSFRHIARFWGSIGQRLLPH